jgi:hypothetical protein
MKLTKEQITELTERFKPKNPDQKAILNMAIYPEKRDSIFEQWRRDTDSPDTSDKFIYQWLFGKPFAPKENQDYALDIDVAIMDMQNEG